jgi:Undecaprenyl-phosphate glucose phosphotransferase
MGKEFPVPGTIPLPSHQISGHDRDLGAANKAYRLFGWVHYKTIGQLTGALDYALVVVTMAAAGFGYHWGILKGDVPNLTSYLAAGNIVAFLFVFGAASRGIYSPNAIASARLQARSVIFFWSLAFLSLALFLFLAKSGAAFSRGTLIIFGVAGLGVLLGTHLWISAALQSALAEGTIACDRAIIIGDRDALSALSWASVLHKAGAREIQRYLLPPFCGSHTDVLSVVDEAICFARSNSVDCILLALQWNDAYRRDLICERLQTLPIRVSLLPDQHMELVLSRSRQAAREFTIELQRPPLSSAELTAKRACDLMLVGSLLIALMPLFFLVCVLIKLDAPGPLIFSQRRRGFNGREFNIFKFRTMNVLEDGHSITQARKNDPRVTRVGRILRATSIDELPQLFNVLSGQMSLVGPRPHAIAHDDAYTKMIAKYALRQHVKPGLTGWAQVNGYRGETARIELMERRVECDLWYIKNWGFWLDLRILVLTCFELVRGRNAY